MILSLHKKPPYFGRFFSFKHKHGRKLLFFLFASMVALFIQPSEYIFEISKEESKEIIFRKKVREGFEFSTKIIHSVQLTPVYEMYRVEKSGQLTLVGTKLKDFGWGMPSTEAGQLTLEEGYWVFQGPPRSLSRLMFRVTYINEPMLIMDHSEFPLTRVAKDGELLIVQIVKATILKTLFTGEINAFQKTNKT